MLSSAPGENEEVRIKGIVGDGKWSCSNLSLVTSDAYIVIGPIVRQWPNGSYGSFLL